MLKAILDQKHPCYDLERWREYSALYHGGAEFREPKLLKRFLPQNTHETAEIYLQRKELSFYRSYINPITNQFSAQLFGSPFAVRARSKLDRAPMDTPSFYHGFKENCDGAGTDLADFARARLTEALIKRIAWARVDLPEGQESRQDLSEADYQSTNLGDAKLSWIAPEDVFDWEIDDNGRLLWVLIHSCSSKRSSFGEIRGEWITETWTLYDQAEISVFEKRYQKGKEPTEKDEIPLVAQRSHGFREVPFRCLEIPEGFWIANKLAEAQIEHFRTSNRLSWSLHRSAYAMPIWKAEDRENPPITGAGYAIVIGKEESFDWASPPTDSFLILAKEIESQRQEIYRLAQQMALAVEANASSIGRSADSKLADQSATEIILQTYASIVKEFLQSLFDLVSAGRGEEIEWSIEGMDSYRITSTADTVEIASNALALGIPSKTWKREQYKYVASVSLPEALSQDVKDTIAQEIDTAEIDITPLATHVGFAPSTEQAKTEADSKVGSESNQKQPIAA